jgi:uncharacterized protein (DUF433 family)
MATSSSASAQTSISKTDGVCGGSACIRNTRIPVWLLIGWRQRGLDDHRILEMYHTLTPADLAAAWQYYEARREEIDREIRENEET